MARRDIDLETYWALVTERYPQFSGYELAAIRLVTEGWDSLVLDVNDEYIFRFPRRVETKVQFEKEASLLVTLARVLTFPIPNFEFIRLDGTPSQCFVGYRKFHGLSLSGEVIHSRPLVEQLGRFLSELHRFPVQQAIHLNIPITGTAEWRQQYAHLYGWVQVNVYTYLQAGEVAYSTTLWENFLADETNFHFRPTLIHGDLGQEHILYDPQNETLSGIIDWGDARVGDPALDFVGLNLAGGQGFVEQILSDYQGSVEESFWRRVGFYTAIVPYYEIQYGLLSNHPKHLERGLQQIKRTAIQS